MKNFKLLEKIPKKMKLTLLCTSIIVAVPLTCCGEELPKMKIVEETQTTTFDTNEHIVSVPSKKDSLKQNVQYDYHEGYIPVGISISQTSCAFSPLYDGEVIVYKNIESVECTSKIVDQNGTYIYNAFGQTKEPKHKVHYNYEDGRIFQPGEHIISIPTKNINSETQVQYEYHEGYEFVGVGNTINSSFNSSNTSGCILYVNTDPVICEPAVEKENYKMTYNQFGKPVTKEKEGQKTLIKKP